MMLPSLFLLSTCLAFGVCVSVFDENLEFKDATNSRLHDDFVFTELKFDGFNPYPPYPHNIYPLFRTLFLHVAKSDERMARLFVSLLSKIGDTSLLNEIQTAVVWKFNNGDYYPYTPDLFNPKVKVKEYTGPVDDSEDTDETFDDATEENSFYQRTGILHDCDENCGKPPLQAGSIKGIPGEDFPDYNEIPITSFSCADKHIPGFYADLETGCQVFHICWPHRRESLLCPIGTIFNQAIAACDYWYSSNCSLAPLYFSFGQLSPKEEALLGSKESLVDFLEKFLQKARMTFEDPSMKSKGRKLHPASHEFSTTASLDKSRDDSTEVPQQTELPTRVTSQPPLTTTHSIESKRIPSADKSYSNIIWAPKSKFFPIKSKITMYFNSDKSVDQETVRLPSTKLPLKPQIDKEKSVSEVLQDILKVAESMTKEAQKFITRLEIDKLKNKLNEPVKPKNVLDDDTDKLYGFASIKTTKKVVKTPKGVSHKPVNIELKLLPEINPRFIVKPVDLLKRTPVNKIKILPVVTPSTLLKPSELLSTLLPN